jgi:hypothetical protein
MEDRFLRFFVWLCSIGWQLFALRNMPEEQRPQTHRGGSLKSRIYKVVTITGAVLHVVIDKLKISLFKQLDSCGISDFTTYLNEYE